MSDYLIQVEQNTFEQKINKFSTPSNNASFGNFYIPIGQLFELHWVFEGSIKSDVLTLL